MKELKSAVSVILAQWFTHFSDLIGATHTSNFKIYEVGGYASDGLKQLAEWGKTQELEKELKTKVRWHHCETLISSSDSTMFWQLFLFYVFQTKDIRTIVKARGSYLSTPNACVASWILRRWDWSLTKIFVCRPVVPEPQRSNTCRFPNRSKASLIVSSQHVW